MIIEQNAERCRQALIAHTGRLADSARIAGPDAAVPTCPDWTVTQLVEHVGQTENWVAEIIERRITDPAQLPTQMATLPDAPDDWPRWLSDAAARAAAACSDPALDAPVFNAAGDDRTGGRFWLHSLVNEAVVHGFDAAAAADEPYDVDPGIAAELITNHLAMLSSPTWAALRPESATALGGAGETLHWRATDPGLGDAGDWFVERGPDGPSWQHRNGSADVTIHGSASTLLPVLTRRLSLTEAAGDLSIEGDVELVRHWIDHSAHVAD